MGSNDRSNSQRKGWGASAQPPPSSTTSTNLNISVIPTSTVPSMTPAEPVAAVPTDAALIAAWRGGDEPAAAELVRRHARARPLPGRRRRARGGRGRPGARDLHPGVPRAGAVPRPVPVSHLVDDDRRQRLERCAPAVPAGAGGTPPRRPARHGWRPAPAGGRPRGGAAAPRGGGGAGPGGNRGGSSAGSAGGWVTKEPRRRPG